MPDVISSMRLALAQAIFAKLARYARLYNHQIPQKALGHISPVQTLKDWREKRPGMKPEAAIKHKSGTTERRFACTRCGKCCYGSIPLTLGDALAQSGRFPLAMVWTPVPRASRAFEWTARLGTTVPMSSGRTRLAVLIAPTAYVPPSFACPALSADHACGIQAEKPLRCRSMPFHPYRREHEQAELLVPKKDWACDTSASAPVVYRDHRIVERADFDAELQALLTDAPLLAAYANTMLKNYPILTHRLEQAVKKPKPESMILSFWPFVRFHRASDKAAFAKRQQPILNEFVARTDGISNLSKYHRYYQESLMEVAWLAKRDCPTDPTG